MGADLGGLILGGLVLRFADVSPKHFILIFKNVLINFQSTFCTSILTPYYYYYHYYLFAKF